MATPYSLPLYQGQCAVADGTKTLWTVPAGAVDIVRDIDAFTVTPGAVVLYLRTDGSSWTALPSAGISTPLSWRGRQVLEAGQTFDVSVAVGTVFLRVSGYRLAA